MKNLLLIVSILLCVTLVNAQTVVKELHDTGRKNVNYYASGVSSGTTGQETAVTLVQAAGTLATSSAASFACTSGKTYRMTSFSVGSVGNSVATAQNTIYSLRMNTAGAVLTTTTPILAKARSATIATASIGDHVNVPIPDGFEIACDGTVQFGVTSNSTFVTNAPTLDVLITGYEY